MTVAFGVGERAIDVEDHGEPVSVVGNHAHHAFPALSKRPTSPVTKAMMSPRTCLNSDGGSQESRASASRRKSRFAFMYAIFKAVEMFTFAHPREMRSWNCASVIPLPPCSAT